MLGTNALDRRVHGLNINQDDYPWWMTRILTWLTMVQHMMECPGKFGFSHKAVANNILSKKDPTDIYGAYEQYQAYYRSYCEGNSK